MGGEGGREGERGGRREGRWEAIITGSHKSFFRIVTSFIQSTFYNT